MIKVNKYLIFLFLFIFLSTYSPSTNNDNKSLFFKIKKIEVENNKILKKKEIVNKLEFIKQKNLLLLDKKAVRSELIKFDFVSSFQIKKIYPDTVKIIINEKKPVAVYISGKNKLYISSNGDLINYIDLNENSELPLVFGKNINFKTIYNDLKKINFPINNIKFFHYFDIGRWDITLKNNKLIKLPTKNYLDILENFILINNKDSFEQYKIFDYRVKDQLILN